MTGDEISPYKDFLQKQNGRFLAGECALYVIDWGEAQSTEGVVDLNCSLIQAAPSSCWPVIMIEPVRNAVTSFNEMVSSRTRLDW